MQIYRNIVLVSLATGVLTAVVGVLVGLTAQEGGALVVGVSLGAGALAALAALPLCLVARRLVVAPAGRLAGAVERMAGGDLDQALDGEAGDLGALRDGLASLAGNLGSRLAAAEGGLASTSAELEATRAERDEFRAGAEGAQATLDKLNATARRAFGISEQVAYSSEGLASQVMEAGSGTQLQRDRVAETATAMEEMNATVLEVAKNAADASTGATLAREKALEGADVVQRAVAAISRVNALAEQLKANMDRLGGQAEAIGQVMTVISDIADQTNLLALNAAIEAARAGDAGRGFAVVADEVRKLAEKTMTATHEVGTSIQAIQEAAKDNQRSMDEASGAVEEATALATESGQALTEIVSLVDDSAGQAQSIAAASEEQSAASEEINRAIDEVNLVATDTAEGMQHAAEAVKSLANLAADLQQLFEDLLGSEGEHAKLAASDTEMRGILPKMMQDFIRKEYGQGAFEAAMEEMGHPTFLANRSYPDKVLEQMASLVAAHKGGAPEDVLYRFGFYTPGEFKNLYRRYFKITDLKEFLLHMNQTHDELTKEEPGITPPRFTYEDQGDVLVMNYHSGRALFPYFEGILNGAAKMFGRKVHIEVAAQGADTARAEIRFL